MKQSNILLIPLLLILSSFLSANNAIISPRIVGGHNSAEGDWPWMVSVNAGGFICGGTLIDNKTILTAAHCLFDNSIPMLSSEVTVTVGEYNKDSIPATPTSNIIKMSIHNDYQPDNYSSSNDIALLHLANPINHITPIALLDSNTTSKVVAGGYKTTTMGWGSTVGYSPTQQQVASRVTSILQDVELPLQTDEKCAKKLNAKYDKFSMVCAAPDEGGKDSCQGDSGGPLIYNHNGNWKQIGIISWGYGCASADYPGVYTRISSYTDWIIKHSKNLFIRNRLNYPYTPVHSTSTQTLLITNYTQEFAQISLTLSGSDQFLYNPATCDTIAPGSTCSLMITYAPNTTDIAQATINIDHDIEGLATLTSTFTATPVVDSSILANKVGFANSNIHWFTGGHALWNTQKNSKTLQTTQINDNQEALLMALITGKGSLNFEWAVSSEAGFDDFEFIVNGEVIDKISGKVNFKAYSYFLKQNVNEVIWRYKKDSASASGNDQAFLKKVTFGTITKPEIITKPETTIVNTSGGGGGGSLLFILLIPSLFMRKYYAQKT